MTQEKNNLLDIHHPHDSLFKEAFKNKEVTIDLLKSRLDPTILQQLDLNTLQLENSSFISEKLKKTYSDLVFSVTTNKTKAYIYLLIEHQTTQDRHMMLRLLEYNIQLMRQHVTQQKKTQLPTIINLVLYAGKNPYTGPKNLLQAFENPALFTALLKRNLVIDLNKESDASILKDQKAALAQWALKCAHTRDFCKLIDQLPFDLAELINASTYAEGTILYMLDREKHEPGILLKKLVNLEPKQQQTIMNALQRIEQRGELKGIKLGEQRGKQEGKKEAFQAMIKKGLISKKIAEQMLKEDL